MVIKACVCVFIHRATMTDTVKSTTTSATKPTRTTTANRRGDCHTPMFLTAVVEIHYIV